MLGRRAGASRVVACWLLLAVAVLAAADPAAACATCYGAADSDMTRAMNNGILVLLVVVGGVQIAFVSMFLGIRRRSRRMREQRDKFQLIRGGGS